MPQIGSFTLLLALALSIYAFVTGIVSIVRKDERLGETARRAGIAIFVATTAAALALVVAALRNDFGLAYILHHSNRDLPIAYKFAALWSGQEGSLLFWTWLLSIYGMVLRVRHKVDPWLVARCLRIRFHLRPQPLLAQRFRQKLRSAFAIHLLGASGPACAFP